MTLTGTGQQLESVLRESSHAFGDDLSVEKSSILASTLIHAVLGKESDHTKSAIELIFDLARQEETHQTSPASPDTDGADHLPRRWQWTLCAAITACLKTIDPVSAAASYLDQLAFQALTLIYLPTLAHQIPPLSAQRTRDVIETVAQILIDTNAWPASQAILEAVVDHCALNNANIIKEDPDNALQESNKPSVRRAASELSSTTLSSLAALILMKATTESISHTDSHSGIDIISSRSTTVLEFASSALFTTVLQHISDTAALESDGGSSKAKKAGRAGRSQPNRKSLTPELQAQIYTASLAKHVLPACIAAGKAHSTARHAACLDQLWLAIKKLAGCATSEEKCRTGLVLLVQFIDPLLKSFTYDEFRSVSETKLKQHSSNESKTAPASFSVGIAADPEFWTLLHQVLTRADKTLDRKRAQHVLTTAIDHIDECVKHEGDGSLVGGKSEGITVVGGASGIAEFAFWKSFFKLYETMEESSVHLFQDVWSEMSVLQQAASAMPADARTTPTLTPFDWTSIIWSLGLEHRNISVQKTVALSFLKTSLSSSSSTHNTNDTTIPKEERARAMNAIPPPEFLSMVLIPTLGRPQMSRGEDGVAIQSHIPTFFTTYCNTVSVEERQELVLGMLRMLSGTDANHSQLLLGSEVLMQVSTGLATAPNHNKSVDVDFETRYLSALKATFKALQRYGGSTFTILIYKRVLASAGSCIGPKEMVTLTAAVCECLQEMPLLTLQQGGDLHAAAVDWVSLPLRMLGSTPILSSLHLLISSYIQDGAVRKEEWTDKKDVQFCSGIARLLLLLSHHSTVLSSYKESSDFFDALLKQVLLEGIVVPGSSFPTDESNGIAPMLELNPRAVILLRKLLEVCNVAVKPSFSSESGSEEGCLDYSSSLSQVDNNPTVNAGQNAIRKTDLHIWLSRSLVPDNGIRTLCRAAEEAYTVFCLLCSGDDPAAINTKSQEERKNNLDKPDVLLECVARLVQLSGEVSSSSTYSPDTEARAACLQTLENFLPIFLKAHAAAAERLVSLSAHPPKEGDNNRGDVQNQEERVLDVIVALQKTLALAIRGLIAATSSSTTESIENTRINAFSRSSNLVNSMTEVLQSILQYQDVVGEAGAAGKAGKAGSWSGVLDSHDWHKLSVWRNLDLILTFFSNMKSSSPTMISTATDKDSSLPSSVLPHQCQRKILILAANGLAGISKRKDHSLVPMIRCVRALLPALLSTPSNFLPASLSISDLSNTARSGLTSRDVENIPDFLQCLLDTALTVLNLQSRRHGGLTPAILSSYLQESIFAVQDPVLLDTLHNPLKNGPIHGFVMSLLASGARIRLLVLVGIQVTALLSKYPNVAKYYVDAVGMLCMLGFDDESFNPVGGDVVFEIECAQDVAAMMRPLDPGLAAAYAGTAIVPRVTMLCLLQSWKARGLLFNQYGEESEDSKACAAVGLLVWEDLFKKATSDAELLESRYFYRGITHRKKIRIWQALAILCPLIPTPQHAEQVLESVFEALLLSNAASVKQYQETVALQMLMKAPQLIHSVLLPKLRDYTHQKLDVIPSLIAVGVHSVMLSRPHGSSLSSPEEEERWKQDMQSMVYAILPWAGSFVHGNRMFSQLVLWHVFNKYQFVWTSDPSLNAFNQFLSTNTDLNRAYASMQSMGTGGLTEFGLTEATSPQGILCKEVSLMGGADPQGHLEGSPKALLESVQAYLEQQRIDLRQELAVEMEESAKHEVIQQTNGNGNGTMTITNQKASCRSTSEGSSSSGTSSNPIPPPTTTTTAAATEFWQRKITPQATNAPLLDPWQVVLGLQALSTGEVDTFESDVLRHAVNAATPSVNGTFTQDLIVVASLIDKIPNLAGLARTCEIFRSCLVIDDVSVVKDPQFTSISVSAENWVPIKQVKAVALAPWLQAMQQHQGYTLVGLEQTAESTRLPEFNFPSKTVLVLGAERTGIPADILQVLDATVEIPQLGVTRSMNVHVSGAVAIYEYTRSQAFHSMSG